MKKLFLFLLLAQPAWAQQIFKEDTAGLKIVTFLTTAGAPVTGLAAGSVACYVTKNGAAEVTLTVTGNWTEIGHGNYALTLSTTDLNTAGRIDGLCTGTGAIAFEWHDGIQPIASYAVNFEGNVATSDVNVVSWKGTTAAATDTAGYPVVTVKDGTGAGEINTSGGNVTTGVTPSSDVNVISWAGTTVATPDTAGYPKVTIKDGTGQGELSITAGQLDGMATPADVATAVWAQVGPGLLDLADGVETGLTIRKCFRAVMSVIANKSDGYNIGTPRFRDFNDTKYRVTSTTNNTGRTSVTFDLN